MAIRALVATDGSESSRTTETFAVRMARALPLELTLCHVLEFQKLEYKMIPDFQVEMIREGARRTAERILEREVAFFGEHGVEVASQLLTGAPGTALCQAAEETGAAFVLIGRRGHGDLQDVLFGSVSNHVIHHCPVPVLVVKRSGGVLPADAPDRPLRALFAYDGSAPAGRCLDYLAGIPEASSGLQLSLIKVINPEAPDLQHLPNPDRYEALASLHRDADALLQAGAERLSASGYQVDTRVEEGSAGKTLCRVHQEDGFDLLILGRYGAGELQDFLFGAVCHYVVHHCPGHVLVVP